MATLTIRNVPNAVHRALRLRAAEKGHSTEAEVRAILKSVVQPAGRFRMGDALSALGRETEVTDEDLEFFNGLRDKTPAEPVTFE